jgi:hypothetical protein
LLKIWETPAAVVVVVVVEGRESGSEQSGRESGNSF